MGNHTGHSLPTAHVPTKTTISCRQRGDVAQLERRGHCGQLQPWASRCFFFFFFFLFCQPGVRLLRNLGPCPLQSRGPSAPTNPCGSPHSLEFSLKVRPEETRYGHLQHVVCSVDSQRTQCRILRPDAFSSALVTPTWMQARRRVQTVHLLPGRNPTLGYTRQVV